MREGKGCNVDDKLAEVLDAHAYMVCRYYKGKVSLAKDKGIHAKSIARIKKIMEQPKEYIYAIGCSDGRGGYGMFDGPTPFLYQMLEVQPPHRDLPTFIFRFTKEKFDRGDLEHKRIFRWHGGRCKWLPLK